MYTFKITKTYHYYGYPKAEYHYEVDGKYFRAEIKYYGNQGYEMPIVTCKKQCNGYYWSLNKFMKLLFTGELDSFLRGIKESETKVFEME